MQDKKPYNKQGQAHGHWETYNDNGKLIYKGLYINGKAFGRHERYHDDGKLFYIMNCINNEYYGYYEIEKSKLYYAK